MIQQDSTREEPPTIEIAANAASNGTVVMPRLVVESSAQVDATDDGYHWKRYGRKMLKSGPFVREYLSCIFPGCPVKKVVEQKVETHLVTYDGNHNHPPPTHKVSHTHHHPSPHQTPPITIEHRRHHLIDRNRRGRGSHTTLKMTRQRENEPRRRGQRWKRMY